MNLLTHPVTITHLEYRFGQGWFAHIEWGTDSGAGAYLVGFSARRLLKRIIWWVS